MAKLRSEDVRLSLGSSDSSGQSAGVDLGAERQRLERELAKREAAREVQQLRRATEEELQKSLGKGLELQRRTTAQSLAEKTKEVPEFLKQPVPKASKLTV